MSARGREYGTLCLPACVTIHPRCFAGVFGYARVVTYVCTSITMQVQCSACSTLACTWLESTWNGRNSSRPRNIPCIISALCDLLVSGHSPPNERATRRAAPASHMPACFSHQTTSFIPGCMPGVVVIYMTRTRRLDRSYISNQSKSTQEGSGKAFFLLVPHIRVRQQVLETGEACCLNR